MNTEARILEAATRVFSSKGPLTTIKEIARLARVNEVTIFRKFSTKEKLFEATLLHGIKSNVMPQFRNQKKALVEMEKYFNRSKDYQRLILMTAFFYPQFLFHLRGKWNANLEVLKPMFESRKRAVAAFATFYGLFVFEALLKHPKEEAHSIVSELFFK